MGRRARLLPVLVAVAVLAATAIARFATTNAHADVLAVLQGSVGPDFAISLKNPDGSIVGHLDGGPYEIQVNDQATNHNFHLEGPGVSMATGIPDIATADWVVTLGDGVFTYHCDQHASLTASFAVGNAALTPPPPPVAPVAVAPPPPVSTPPPTPAAVAPAPVPPVSHLGGTIRATLADTKLTLTLDGTRLTTLPAGTYRLVVVDRSRSLGLSLARTSGAAVNRVLTAAGFTGTKTVTIDLPAGRWKISSAGQAVVSPFAVTRHHQ